MTRFLSLFLLFLSLSPLVLADELIFAALLDGRQQVPVVATSGEGAASFDLDLDDFNFSWDIAYDDLDSGITAAHIHGPAPPGANAGHAIELSVSSGSTSGSIRGNQVISEDQADALRNGLWYVNIHTSLNPDGEIRGQIITTETTFFANLQGSQEVPAVTTNASGKGNFDLDPSTLRMEFEITHNIANPTAMHIHGPAPAGTNADPIIIFDNVQSPIRGFVELTPVQVLFLRTQQLYLNVHSVEHPNGELRGQLEITDDTSGGNHWWIVGLITASLALLVVATITIAAFLYMKNREKIVQMQKPKNPVRMGTADTSVSAEPLLADSSDMA